MNINNINQLIPDPYREVSVPETFMYYRSGQVFPITGEYIAQNGDFTFKFKKTNGVVEIKEVKNNEIPGSLYTPEEWVQKYFTNLEVIALIRLEQSILLQGKNLGQKMETSKQWLEQMMFASPSNNFSPAPYSYKEISEESNQILFNE